MPRHWIQRGRIFSRDFHVDDTKHIPDSISAVSEALDTLISNARKNKIGIKITEGNHNLTTSTKFTFELYE